MTATQHVEDIPARPYTTEAVWRVVIDGEPDDAVVGRIRVGDIRTLLARIDELESYAVERAAGRPVRTQWESRQAWPRFFPG